ncbi:MAG: tripartite tricarboxylate transporter substrate binding protein [Lautropia sp.]
MPSTLRLLTHTVFALATAIAASTANAQAAYPNQPIKLIVGFPPGGSADILARAMAEKLWASLGHPVVIENRPGASGTIAAAAVAKAPADGHHLLFASSAHAGSGALYPKLSYDPIKDFAPVAKVGATPIVIVAPATGPFHRLSEVLDQARKSPGKLNYAAGAAGATTTSLAAEFLKSEAKIEMQMIPYKGNAPALNALLAGEVDFGFDIPASAMPHIQGGKLRLLAVTSKVRSTIFPAVPTVAELAVPNFDVMGWFGVLAPAGTPAPVIDRLNKELNAALDKADVKQRLASLAVEPGGGDPAAFGALLESDAKRYGDAIRRLGIKVE